MRSQFRQTSCWENIEFKSPHPAECNSLNFSPEQFTDWTKAKISQSSQRMVKVDLFRRHAVRNLLAATVRGTAAHAHASFHLPRTQANKTVPVDEKLSTIIWISGSDGPEWTWPIELIGLSHRWRDQEDVVITIRSLYKLVQCPEVAGPNRV